MTTILSVATGLPATSPAGGSGVSVASIFFVIIGILVLMLYLLPTIISISRNHQNKVGIILVNIFLGVTLIGWLVSLIWSCTTPSKPIVINQTSGVSASDEIIKYKKLFDDGVITEEEYEKKKKELLGSE